MFCWPKGLSSRGMNEFVRRYNDSTELEVETTAWSFGFLMPLNPKTRKGVTVLTGVIAPDPSGETGVLLHSGGQESLSGIQKVPYGFS